MKTPKKALKEKTPTVTKKYPEKYPVNQEVSKPVQCDCTMCRTLDIQPDDDPAVQLTKQLSHGFQDVSDQLLERAYAFIARNFAEVSSAAIKLFLESWTEFHEDTLWLELVIFEGEVYFAQMRSEKKKEYFTGGGSSPLEAVMNTIAIVQLSPKRP